MMIAEDCHLRNLKGRTMDICEVADNLHSKNNARIMHCAASICSSEAVGSFCGETSMFKKFQQFKDLKSIERGMTPDPEQ